MGYYTKYELEVKGINEVKVTDFINEHRKKDPNFMYPVWTEDGELYITQECKWYGHDEDMDILSKQFPEALFTLHGRGEEDWDLWKKYYKNGKSQRCEGKVTVTFEPLDMSKLS